MKGVSPERPVYGGEMEERADDVLRIADNGHKQGLLYVTSQARASDGGLWRSWLLMLDRAGGAGGRA